MDISSMCRICLTEDINLHSILGTNLQKLYEKLTDMPFYTEDKPLNICYICCARLRNCYRLQTSCLKSEELLTQILANNKLKPKQQYTNTLKIVHPRIQFSCTPMMKSDDDEEINIQDDTKEIIYNIQVKEETVEDAQDNIIDYTENIKHMKLESIVKIERDDTQDSDASNHSIHCEKIDDNSTANYIELNIEERVIKEDKLCFQNVNEVIENSLERNDKIISRVPSKDVFLKRNNMALDRTDLEGFTTTMTSEKESKPKLKRKFISLQQKIDILDQLNKGKKLKVIAKELELNESTIRTIKQNESKIRSAVKSRSLQTLSKSSRVKDTLIAKTEKHLIIWLQDCKLNNIPTNSCLIKAKAQKIFTRLKDLETVSSDKSKSKFVSSNGWFERFRKRFPLHNI